MDLIDIYLRNNKKSMFYNNSSIHILTIQERLRAGRMFYPSPSATFKVALKFPEGSKLYKVKCNIILRGDIVSVRDSYKLQGFLNRCKTHLSTPAVDLKTSIVRSLSVHLSLPFYRFVLRALLSLSRSPSSTLGSFRLKNS